MSLTTVTVTGKWRLPDATIPTGTVRFEPSAAFQNTTDDTFVVNSVEATLDASGAISVDLYATDDADTTPDGAQYVVTERIAGATRIYNVEIPSANPNVDLADLVPTTTPAAVTYLTPSSHDARDHSAALSAASVRDLSDGADVPVDDGTLSVGELVTVKSLSPLVVEGTASGTYLSYRHMVVGTEVAATDTDWDTITLQTADWFGARRASSNTQNAEVGWDLPLAAGTYTFRLFHTMSSQNGIYHVHIDGTEVGTIDGYAASTTPGTVDDITGITVPETKNQRVLLVMETKNASASSYKGLINGFSLTRTGA